MITGTKSFWERLVQRLGSLKLSFFLMIFLSLLVIQRAIIAQKEVLPQTGEGIPWFIKALNALGLNTPESLDFPFVAAMILFVINLGFSSLIMARKIRKKQRGLLCFREPQEIQALGNSTEFRLPLNSNGWVVQTFKCKGFIVNWEKNGPETRLYADKHETGRWGVLFFHLTFFIVLVGVLVSYLTRYSGYLELSPGDQFMEQRESYLRITQRPMLFGEDKKFRIELKEIDLSYWKPGVIRQRAGVVNLYDMRGTFIGEKKVEVNSPLKISGIKIYQGNKHGFIAGLEITDEAGTRVTALAQFEIPGKTERTMTSRIGLPGTGLTLNLELFTEKLGDIEGLEQFKSRHMATLIKVTSVEGPHRTFRGVVFGGASLSFEGLTLQFVTLKPYTSLIAVQDYGVPVIFSGFFFLLLGLVVTYFWVPENYWAVIRNEESEDLVVIGAATEKYKESFKERFAEEMEELKKEMERTI